MRRDGYIVVPSGHRLFPDSVARAVEGRAQSIIAAVESSHSLTLTPLAFTVHQQPQARRLSSQFVRALFDGSNNEHVRVLVAEQAIPADVLKKPFEKTKLLITIKDVGGSPSHLRAGPLGPSSGNIEVNGARVERAIEDIIIDIALGTFFREQTPIRDLVATGGLPALFREKVRFARRWRLRSWLAQVDRGATYAMLSSLNRLPDEDVTGRAANAYDTWLEFSQSLTAASIAPPSRLTASGGPTARSAEAEAPVGYDVAIRLEAGLVQTPKLGGQLPIRRIVAVAASLPAGEYSLIVLLRSSSARKSPSLRGQLTALFGLHARRNSFRILSNERFLSARHIIDKLARSGHIFVVKLVLESASGPGE